MADNPITFHGGPEPYQPSLYLGGSQSASPPEANDLLANLLKSLTEPAPAPPQHSVLQNVAGALSDAMMAKARVWAGNPIGEGPYAKKSEDEHKTYEGKLAAVQSQNAAAKRTVAGEVYGLAKQKEAERIADERAASAEQARQALERQKEEFETRGKLTQQVFDYVKAGGKLPPNFDFASATPESVLGMMQAGLQDRGVSADISAALANALAMKHGLEAMGLNVPVSGAEATAKGGNVTFKVPETPKVTDMEGPVTQTTARQAANARVEGVAKMTEGQALEAIADAKKAQDEARLARLNKKTDRGNKVQDEILALNDVKRSILKAQAFIAADPTNSDATMAAPDTYFMARDFITGSNYLAKKTDLNSFLGEVEQKKTKLLAGSAVSPSEAARVAKTVALLSDYLTVKQRKLQDMLDTINESIADRQKAFGLTPDDMDHIDDPSYVPTQLNPAAVVLGTRGN